MRSFLLSLVLAGVLACGGDETATGSSTSSASSQAVTNSATSSSTASGTGGSGQGGASQGGGGAGQGGSMGGTFACGSMLQCQHGNEYCDVFLPGVPCGMPTYNCLPLPGNCQPDPSCDCFPSQGLECMCSESPEGDITVSCMGI